MREAGRDAVIASTRLMLERNASRAGGFYPDFACADILVTVEVKAIDSSYTRHFLDRVTRPR